MVSFGIDLGVRFWQFKYYLSLYLKLMTSAKDKKFWFILSTVIFVFLPFSLSLFGYFHADDWGHLLTPINARWWQTFYGDWFSGTQSPGNFFRPLIRLSIVLDKTLYGYNPSGFHLTNLLFHLLNVILLYQICKLLFWKKAERNFIFLPALLFGIFPLHHQAVYWVSGRTDVIVSCFVLATMLCLLKFCQRGNAKYGVLALLFCLLALLSKETAIAAIPISVLTLWLFYSPRMKSFQVKVMFSFFFLFLGILYLLYRHQILPPLNFSRILTRQNFTQTYGSFLTFLYTPWRTSNFTFSLSSFSLQLLLPVILLVFFGRHCWKPLLFALSLVFFSIAPMLGLSANLTDGQRLLYLPASGWIIFWVFLLREILLRCSSTFFKPGHPSATDKEIISVAQARGEKILIYGLSLVVGIFAFLSFKHSFYWLQASQREKQVVQRSLQLIKKLAATQPRFSVALLSEVSPPVQRILHPLDSLHIALWVLGEPAWDLNIYFKPEQDEKNTFALIIKPDYTIKLFAVEKIVRLEWTPAQIIANWRFAPGLQHRLITTATQESPLLEITGDNLTIASPPLDIPAGWLLLTLTYQLTNEATGRVFLQTATQVDRAGEYLLFNDVGGKFATRNVPLGYHLAPRELTINFSPLRGTANITHIVLLSYILNPQAVF